MPFTPFHMGPALAIKAVTGRRFSVLAFGIAQVAMDIEPLVGMIRGSEVLHGPTHTYLGAVVIGTAVAAVSPLICGPILRYWNRQLSLNHLGWLATPGTLERIPAIAGAFVGTISHVILDSVMHSDISPLAPWSNANVLRGMISIEALHQVCVLSGLLGVAAWLIVGWRNRKVAGEG